MAEFHFIRPLWLLALIPLALLLWRSWRRGGALAAWREVCDPHLLAALTVGGGETEGEGRLPRLLLGLGWLLAVIALAGPTWEPLPQPLYKPQAARVILLDLSRSMDAGDLAPSRLERARFKVLDILERSREGQTALIVFAAEPYVVAPLTDDTATVANLLRPLTTELMPAQGSRADRALERGEALLEQAGVPGGELLLVGDGVDDAALRVAEELHAKGRRVSVLAVGSEEGAPIPITGGGFLKDGSGAIVIPKLEEGTLRRLATAGGGRYHRLTADDRDLNVLLTEPSRDVAERAAESAVRGGDAWREEGPWLVLALLPLALIAFRRGWLGAVLVVLLLPPPADAFEWAGLWQRPDQRGAGRFEQSPAEAAKAFEDPSWRGSAYYRAGDYEEALKAWQGVGGADGHYNRGNALAKQGRLKEALEAYDQALGLDPDMEDAAANRTLVEELLRQSQPPQGQQGGESDDRQSGEGESQPQPGQSGQPDDRGDADPQADSPQDSSGQASGSGAQPEERDGAAPQPTPGEEEGKGADDDASREGEGESRAARAEEPSPPDDQSPQEGPASASDDGMSNEEKMRVEQWLRRVPDDPGGLLRRKFLLEHRRRGNQTENEERW